MTSALLLEAIHPDAAALLGESRVGVQALDTALDPAELVRQLTDRPVQLLGIRSKTQLTSEVFDAAPDLLAVGAFCIGTNQIDLAAASRRGVAVFNAPFSNTRSVVELAIAEIIALTRGLTDKSAQMHAGVWDKSASGAHEVRGRRLGIVGYGNIGTQLSVLAEAMGMLVSFFDTADRLAMGNARRCGSLGELLESADIVSLHVDGRPENSRMFGADEFARMRPGSLFMNLSRGFVVDHAALCQAIRDGHLAGAAVDVFPAEPKGRGEEFRSELRGLPNVILTPHIGGSTEEAQQDIGRYVAAKLRDFLVDGTTTMSVNLPGLVLPLAAGAHRLLHLHHNTPGVLATIDGILAEHGVNIAGQLLGTRDAVGYVITDIDVGYPPEVVARLSAMPETLRLRLVP